MDIFGYDVCIRRGPHGYFMFDVKSEIVDNDNGIWVSNNHNHGQWPQHTACFEADQMFISR